MKDVRMILPNTASDTAGAASLLFQLGGLSIIHDAAGSMEVFVTFDEPRDLTDRRTVVSRLSRLEAVTGNDGILLGKIIDECQANPPAFISIIGTPVPFTIGTDLDGIAAEAENELDIPSFAVTAGGFDIYDKGVADALKKIIEKTAKAPQKHDGYRINLLGATPLDYSPAEIDGIKEALKQKANIVCDLTMTDGMEDIYSAANADLNLVISVSGLAAARYMKTKYNIPYHIGFTLFDENDVPQADADKKVLIIGEAVFAKQMALLLQKSGIYAVAGVTGNDDKEIFPDVPTVYLHTEKGIKQELKKDYFAVVGDPIYKQVMPKDSNALFIERQHRAISSRLYPQYEKTPYILLDEIKDALQ